jgi:hypothetical protein
LISGQLPTIILLCRFFTIAHSRNELGGGRGEVSGNTDLITLEGTRSWFPSPVCGKDNILTIALFNNKTWKKQQSYKCVSYLFSYKMLQGSATCNCSFFSFKKLILVVWLNIVV